MKFNLDLAASALAAWQPRCHYQHSAVLDLDRTEVFSAFSTPQKGCLYLLDPATYRILPPPWAHAGCAYLTIGPIDAARSGMPALALEGPCTFQEPYTALLDMRAKLDQWSDDVLRAIAASEPLQKVFDVVARAFKNPLLLADSALLFVLTAGSLPSDFHDRFWTPTIETGVCPVERYSETWRRVVSDEYLRKQAVMVEDRETGRHYIYRNLIAEDGMHGMFELMDVNAPFTDADITLVEHVASMLTLAVHRSTYRELSSIASDPLYRLLEGRPASEQALLRGLAKRGWSIDDAYYVCYAVNSVDTKALGKDAAHLNLTAETTLLRTARPDDGTSRNGGAVTGAKRYEVGRHVQQQLEQAYPRSCVFSTGGGCIMVVRDKDRPYASMREEFQQKALDPDDPAELVAGVSSLHTDFRRLAAARDQAHCAISWAESDHGGMLGSIRTCFYDDVFCQDLAERLDVRRDVDWLVPESVSRLAANDAADGTEYVRTLRVYLDHGCNVNRAADALFVHRNTLAYRIKRIKAISGIDLENPAMPGDDLLRVWLACRMLEEME